MGWGRKTLDREGMRDALLSYAAGELTGRFGKPNELVYAAALYAEQVRTNELLEQLLTERVTTP